MRPKTFSLFFSICSIIDRGYTSGTLVRTFKIVFQRMLPMLTSFQRMLLLLQNYFKDSWNVFDFITVVGSIIDVLVTEVKVSGDVTPLQNSLH